MRVLDLQSERYSPTGNAAAEGISNQLGRPNLHPLSILVRETVQNSWDARVSSGTPVTYGIRFWQATDGQVSVLKHHVFRQWPQGLHCPPALVDGARTSGLKLMAIYDRGTSGLGGPTRADEVARGPEKADFVQFLRNVGEPPDVEFGGGTYGYGKAATYLTSRSRTVCIHTHCWNEGQPESRFLAAALGSQFSITGEPAAGRYTGRHWWGADDGGIVDPVRSSDADELAEACGLPGFAGDERGTTLLVIDPILEGGSDLQGELAFDDPETRARNIIRDTLLWYFWPKMMAGDSGSPAMNFVMSWNGEDVEVPRPEDHQVVGEFVAAMKTLKDSEHGTEGGGQLSRSFPISSQRPVRDLGRLVLRRFVHTPTGPVGDENGADPIQGRSHHVALMRRAELVVNYRPGPTPAIGELDYCGVFMTEDDPEIDRAFAASEPPTHDDWVPATLPEKQHRTFVNVALRRIDLSLQEFASPAAGDASGSDQIAPLGLFSELMADLLPGEEATGAGPSGADGSSRSGGGAGRPRAVVNVIGRPILEARTAGPVALVRFRVQHAGDAPTIVTAELAAGLDGPAFTAEREPPAGAPVPEVVEWIAPDGKRHGATQSMEIPASTGGEWAVAVTLPADSAVVIQLSARAGNTP